MKGMILAAGYGERLRPQTDEKPKPLFEIGQTTMIKNSIGYLQSHGINEIAVNLHHLGEMIKDEIAPLSGGNLNLHLIEEKEIMGTAGGIKGAEQFMDGSEFVVINSDILTDLDLEKAIGFFREKKALAMLVLRDNTDTKKFGTLRVDSDGRLVEFLKERSPFYDDSKIDGTEMMFTGVHIFSPKIFGEIPDGPSDISKAVYPKLMESGAPVFAMKFPGYWADIGTHESYANACNDVENKIFRTYPI